MVLDKLSILNYKSILQAEVSFSPRMNCLFGHNGMGKTNLLDAIYYLSFCKSHLHTPDGQIIHHGQELCVVQGKYTFEGERKEELFCALRRGQRKQFKRNKKEYDKLSEHIGLLPLVMVSPADAALIQGGSEERRRFLDLVISQYDKPYLHALIHYNKALQQRNTLLKEQSSDAALYDVLEMQLDRYARQVFEKRKQLVEEFVPVFNRYYQALCSFTEQASLSYVSQLDHCALSEALPACRRRDGLLGYTSTGVHKDELEMNLGDNLIRRTGSEGQNKTYLVALKLAQFTFLAGKGRTTPVLLLDDIFDKLDAGRVERIIRLVGGAGFGQIFVTDTNRKHLDEILSASAAHHDCRLFEVERGEVLPFTGQQ
jgi:DNA replication and repair protein RecF